MKELRASTPNSEALTWGTCPAEGAIHYGAFPSSTRRSRGMLRPRPVVTWLLQTVVRPAAFCCDRTAAMLLWIELQQAVVNRS